MSSLLGHAYNLRKERVMVGTKSQNWLHPRKPT